MMSPLSNLLTLFMVSDAHHIPIGIELNFKFESSSMWYIIVPNITCPGLYTYGIITYNL